MHLIFFYTRFADYFYKSLLDLLSDNERITAHIVRYQQDKNAPFVFEETNNLKLYNYDDFSSKNELLNFVIELEPKLIYVSGWSNKCYNYVVSKFYNLCPTIVGLDNPWEGKFRQYLGIFYYRIFMRSYFSHVWVAGKPQYRFARYLGFKQDKILIDLYSANTKIFEKAYHENKKIKTKVYPKILIFIGRYVSYKQPLELVKCFNELEKDGLVNNWKLELIGSGPQFKKLTAFQSSSILINDFIKPIDLPQKLASSGAFCLPSKSEHWGVVVHEAAAAGLPLLLSNTTYAGTHFLVEGFNGHSFNEKKNYQLKDKLKLLFSKNNKELNDMSYNSYQLSKLINHKTWAANLLSVLN